MCGTCGCKSAETGRSKDEAYDESGGRCEICETKHSLVDYNMNMNMGEMPPHWIIICSDCEHKANYGAETKLSKTSCCCGADESNPCACMKAPEPMECSAKAPKCACYKALEKNAETFESNSNKIIVTDKYTHKKMALVGKTANGTPIWNKATSTGKIPKNARAYTTSLYGAGWYDRLLNGERHSRHEMPPKRTEPQLMEEIYHNYTQWEYGPENLWEDGEASLSRVKQKLALSKRKIKIAEKELGRKVSKTQAIEWAKKNTNFENYGAETFEANSDEDNCPVCNEEVYGDMSMIGEEIVPDICGDCDIYVMPQGSDFKVRCIECGYGDFYGSRTPCESCEPIADKMEAVNNGKSAETFEADKDYEWEWDMADNAPTELIKKRLKEAGFKLDSSGKAYGNVIVEFYRPKLVAKNGNLLDVTLSQNEEFDGFSRLTFYDDNDENTTGKAPPTDWDILYEKGLLKGEDSVENPQSDYYQVYWDGLYDEWKDSQKESHNCSDNADLEIYEDDFIVMECNICGRNATFRKETPFYGPRNAETFEAAVIRQGKAPKGAMAKAMMNQSMMEQANIEAMIQELENKVNLGLISEDDLMASLKKKFGAEYDIEVYSSEEDLEAYFADLKKDNPKLAKIIEFKVKNEEYLPKKLIESSGYDYEILEAWNDYVIDDDKYALFDPCPACEGEGWIMTSYTPATRFEPADGDGEDCGECGGSGKIDPSDYMYYDDKGEIEYEAETKISKICPNCEQKGKSKKDATTDYICDFCAQCKRCCETSYGCYDVAICNDCDGSFIGKDIDGCCGSCDNCCECGDY